MKAMKWKNLAPFFLKGLNAQEIYVYYNTNLITNQIVNMLQVLSIQARAWPLIYGGRGNQMYDIV